MNYKKLWSISLIVLLLLPVSLASAKEKKDKKDIETYKERLNDHNTIFFLIALKDGDQLKCKVMTNGSATYELFIFDERPIKSHINIDGSIDEEIYDLAVDYDKEKEPVANCTAKDDQLYYIQIILDSGGPDIFTLKIIVYSDEETPAELTQYYLPAIPGYQLEFIIIATIAAIGIAIVIIKKKINKKNSI